MLPTLLQKRCILLLHDFHWKLCKLSTRKVIFVLCSNCLGLLKRREKRLAKQSGLQGRKQRQALFAQGGQVAPNTRKGLCAPPRAEAARDLLLYFDHAQISLCQIVGLSRQLHRLPLWRKEFSRSPIRFIPCTASSLRSSPTGTTGGNIASRFTRPLSMSGCCQQPGPALLPLILV